MDWMKYKLPKYI